MHPGSPSAMSNFIFPPPDHSLNPTPSHRAGQSCPSPAPPRWGLPDRPTYAHQLPGRWHSVCHPFPPSRPREMKGGGGAHQLPASGTGIPPTRPAPSHRGGSPKASPPLLPHSLRPGESISPTPSSPRRVCSSQPRRGTVGDGLQPSALPPCQASRESAKQSVFGASRAAGGPRKHRAPKKQGARFTRGEVGGVSHGKRGLCHSAAKGAAHHCGAAELVQGTLRWRKGGATFGRW